MLIGVTLGRYLSLRFAQAILAVFTTVFTLAGFYEVIELWDDKYMHASPGWRIHGPYDTANDLQWDFIGMGVGAILSYFVLRRYEKNTR